MPFLTSAPDTQVPSALKYPKPHAQVISSRATVLGGVGGVGGLLQAYHESFNESF
jgi:hypothetical protein